MATKTKNFTFVVRRAYRVTRIAEITATDIQDAARKLSEMEHKDFHDNDDVEMIDHEESVWTA